MSTQPEALRLAEENEKCAQAWVEGSEPHQFRLDTSAELRRLHAVNSELLGALLLIDPTGKFTDWHDGRGEPIGKRIATSISKATVATT